MLRIGLVALGLAALVGCIVSEDELGVTDDNWSFEDQEFDAILVQVGNGSIDVRSTPGPAEVEWTGGGFGDAASPDIWVEDRLLRVDANSGPVGGGDIVVWLPDGMGIGAWIDYGAVTIDLDTRSDVVACAWGGDVRIDVPAGRWDLHVESPVGDTYIAGIDDDGDSPWRLYSRVAAGSLEINGR
jgi:hypothetical protein